MKYNLSDFEYINPFFSREFRKFKIYTFLDISTLRARHEAYSNLTTHKEREDFYFSLTPIEQSSLNNKLSSIACPATLKDGTEVFVTPVLKAFDPEWDFDREVEEKEGKPWVVFFSGSDDESRGMRFKTEAEADAFIELGVDVGELELAWHN